MASVRLLKCRQQGCCRQAYRDVFTASSKSRIQATWKLVVTDLNLLETLQDHDMNQYKLLFFGWLSEQTGCKETSWESSASNCQSLLQELTEHYSLDTERTRHFNVAVNDEYSDMQTSLKNGDLVVFIPPVAGG
jgi:molybdopterin synthase sulfur carrier subunit